LSERDGATAVEFAIIAIPFFGLLFAVFQTALVFWTTQVLETAVANASRQIYTQQFAALPQNAGADPATLKQNFKNLVCANVRGLFNCATMVDIDVRVLSDFSAGTTNSPVTNGVYNASGYTFQMPQPNQIVVVRASMEYPNLATIGAPATTLKNGNWLIMASAAFRTEP
jgi:Flp pilus assembly protein TadG